MRDIYIRLHPDGTNVPLATLNAGKLSSAVLIICGDIPTDIADMFVAIGRTPDKTTTPPTPRENYSAPCARQSDGTWRCYLSPYLFPDAALGLAYHVIGTDTAQNKRWLGSGTLDVRDNPAAGSATPPPIVPHDAYAYNPTTGLYHKINAVLDELGQISIAVESQGVQR